MWLVIVVVGLLVGGVLWRARSNRRLTIEESVDRYRRTLSAVHEAAARSTMTDGDDGEPSRFEPATFAPPPRPAARSALAGSRRSLLVAAMTAVTVVAVGIAVIASHGKGSHRSSGASTTRPSATGPSTSTTRPAPSTTTPLVSANGASGTAFTIAKPTFTIVVQTTTGICWVDMRDPSGAALFSGTLAVGASQSVTASDVTLRLGNPAAVTVSIDGTSVPITLAAGSPVSIHFRGSPAHA